MRHRFDTSGVEKQKHRIIRQITGKLRRGLLQGLPVQICEVVEILFELCQVSL